MHRTDRAAKGRRRRPVLPPHPWGQGPATDRARELLNLRRSLAAAGNGDDRAVLLDAIARAERALAEAAGGGTS